MENDLSSQGYETTFYRIKIEYQEGHTLNEKITKYFSLYFPMLAPIVSGYLADHLSFKAAFTFYGTL